MPVRVGEAIPSISTPCRPEILTSENEPPRYGLAVQAGHQSFLNHLVQFRFKIVNVANGEHSEIHPELRVRTLASQSQIDRNPAAMKLAITSFTATKSSDRQTPPDSLSIRPVRASVSIRAPVTK